MNSIPILLCYCVSHYQIQLKTIVSSLRLGTGSKEAPLNGHNNILVLIRSNYISKIIYSPRHECLFYIKLFRIV